VFFIWFTLRLLAMHSAQAQRLLVPRLGGILGKIQQPPFSSAHLACVVHHRLPSGRLPVNTIILFPCSSVSFRNSGIGQEEL